MKKIVKFILKILSFFSKRIKNYAFEWFLFSKASFGLLLVNFIYQRIFRINSDADIPVHFTSRIIDYKKIKFTKDENTVGSFCLSLNCYIQAMNGIEIGKNFLFAPGIRIISANHGANNEFQDLNCKPVKIGDNVWFGTNVIILPEVSIGNNVVVGAGSVVTKSFPDNVIIAGNPAKVIKNLNEDVRK